MKFSVRQYPLAPVLNGLLGTSLWQQKQEAFIIIISG